MKTSLIYKKESCRACLSRKLEKVFGLGPTPLANAFLKPNQIDGEEYFYPLDVYFCHDCTMLQLGHVVDSRVLFSDYVYVSSTSPVFIAHFEEFGRHVSKKLELNKNDLVIDIGSNDGILLKPFKKLGYKVLGIEPAKQIAAVAKREGVPTVAEFFSVNVAKDIVKKYGHAMVMTATNVFAHIDDLDEVIKGIKILLDKDGVYIIEAPYLIDFIEKRYFDLVYHEHVSYWSVASLIAIFKRFDMEVFDVEKVDAHGGSIRVYVKKKDGNFKKTQAVGRFLTLEKDAKLNKVKTYLDYRNEILKNRMKLIDILTKVKLEGKSIAAYGAPAKGNTILNFFGIGPELIDFVVDDSSWKQGLFSPGKRIPVVPSSELYKRKPDYLLILAWNFASSIMKNHEKYRKNGGKFIVPVPQPKII
jgi:SAM-dependent methyltransferase